MSQDEFPNLPCRSRFWWGKWLFVALMGAVVVGLLLPVNSCGPIPAGPINARHDVEQLTAALQNYVLEYDAPPRGSSADIMRVLLGDNPRKIVYFEALPKQFNAAGELLDPWKIPYRIDTSDPLNPRVYSFGPNRHDDDNAPSSDDIRIVRYDSQRE